MHNWPSQREIASFRDQLLSWAAKDNLREFKWRKTESPYNVFIAEILLGATLAKKVVPIYDEFLRRYPDFQTLASAREEEIARLLEPLGLQNRRANAFKNIAHELADEGVPSEKRRLMDLPYVGNYAASATLCFGFGKPVPIVDSNVVRVYNRAFGLNLKQEQTEAWDFAETILPEDEARTFNLALLDFGAAICTSPSPQCRICFYSSECDFATSQATD